MSSRAPADRREHSPASSRIVESPRWIGSPRAPGRWLRSGNGGQPERKLRTGRVYGAASRDESEPPCTPPGISDSQARTAALNAGELSFSRWCSMCTPPPENVGSGKLGIPCERMHAAAFRYCDCSWGVIWWFERSPGPPPGSSLLQACCADLKWGLPVMAGVTPIATFTSLPLVETFGSGKLGTPCARTHAEYATAWPPGDAELLDPPLDPAAVEFGVDVLDACDPRLATPPVGELPPQPATSTLRTTSAAVREAARARPPAALL